jgi:hypothetical protein
MRQVLLRLQKLLPLPLLLAMLMLLLGRLRCLRTLYQTLCLVLYLFLSSIPSLLISPPMRDDAMATTTAGPKKNWRYCHSDVR